MTTKECFKFDLVNCKLDARFAYHRDPGKQQTKTLSLLHLLFSICLEAWPRNLLLFKHFANASIHLYRSSFFNGHLAFWDRPNVVFSLLALAVEQFKIRYCRVVFCFPFLSSSERAKAWKRIYSVWVLIACGENVILLGGAMFCMTHQATFVVQLRLWLL